MRRHFAFALVILLAAARLTAEGSAPSWGTSAENVRTISAFSFEVPNSATYSFDMSVNGSRYFTTGTSGSWYAPLDLPTGSLLTALELQGCDQDAFGRLSVAVFQLTVSGGAEVVTLETPVFDTGQPQTPNCDLFSFPLTTPLEIDNAAGSYVVRVNQIGASPLGELRFAAVRLRYKLQVSPAPGVARFTDVPTGHPYFRFVEALAASGITAGCGGTDFCPDDPLTRGQMAVFLAAALGLHFPN